MNEKIPFRIGLVGLYGLLALLIVLRNFHSILTPIGLMLIGEAMGLCIVAVVTVYGLLSIEGDDKE